METKGLPLPVVLTASLLACSFGAPAKDLFVETPCKAAYEYHFLNRAVAFNDFVGVGLLLEGGADPDGKGYDKLTECISLPGEFSSPLSLAVRNGNIEIARLLIEAGADPNFAEGESVTPTRIARSKGYTEILQLLVEHGGR